MNGVMILLKDVSIGYRGHVVASGLSHSFEAGTLTLLTGRNGSGKSTLLRTIAGIQPALNPTKVSLPLERGEVAEGRRGVFIYGQPITSYNSKDLARLRAVVQTHYRPVNLPVRQVVEMGRTAYTGLMGRLTETDHEAVAAALAACTLTDYADRSFSCLSDGERQRVMIAAAVAQDTPIILLDEPTAFLDYESRQQHFALLRSLADQGKCLICATHDLDIARRYTNLEYKL